MINIAIVGCGNIAHAHLEGLLTFPGRCQVIALCDIYPEKAEAMKLKYNLKCNVYADHVTMLAEEPELTLVHVCTPPYVHAEISIHALNAGCNVVVEKPMATCLAECDQMLKAEKQSKKMLACIAQNRFRNSIYKLKNLADSGLAGKICCAHVNSLWWRGHCYYDLWWRGTWEKEGGGPTLNHAVHHIDMLNWIEGKLPTEVMSMMTNVMHDNAEVEDLSLAILRYDDNSLAQVTSSVIHHGEEQGIVLQCANAKLSAPWDVKAEISQENGFWKPGGNKELTEQINSYYKSLPDLPYEGHTGEIDNILTALETNNKPLITGEDGRKTVELITAIYKAGCEKKLVTLPIKPDDDYYTFNGLLAHATRFYKKTSFIENFSQQKISLGNYKPDDR